MPSLAPSATDRGAEPGRHSEQAPSTTVELGVLGARVRVTVGPEAGARLAETWARCLSCSDDVVAEELSLPLTDLPLSPEMELRLTERVTLAGISYAAEDHVLLHAAGLAAPDGSVLGLVAPSGTGKTTAAVHLATHGFGYVTDETLAVGADLAVRPWPKPLALVDPEGGPKRLRGPDGLGLARADGRLHLSRLVVLDRAPGVPRATLAPIEAAEALAVLVGQSSALGRLERPLRRLESMLTSVGGLWRLRYSEIAEATPLLAGALGVGSAPTPLRGPVPPRVFVSPVRDALAVGEGLAVLTGEGLTHLTGVGAEVWRAAHGGVTRDELAAAVTEVLGPHPDAALLVAATVDDLVARGLLELDAGAGSGPSAGVGGLA